MAKSQRLLNRFLQIEMYHSLGSYGPACDELSALSLEHQALSREPNPPVLPRVVLERTHQLNEQLRDHIHRADDDFRHPEPRDPAGGSNLMLPSDQHTWIFWFYRLAIQALRDRSAVGEWPELQQALILSPARVTLGPKRLAGKLARYESRYAEVQDIFREASSPFASPDHKDALFSDHLSNHYGDCEPLHKHIIEALTHAHLRMHYIEHLYSASFAVSFDDNRHERVNQANHELRQCISINTFAYAVASCAPWIFAEDLDEQRYVRRSYDRARRELMPQQCMWIAQQVAFVAIFRRAYARKLLGQKRESFNDYLKVQRLMRAAMRSLADLATSPPGASQFTSALDALAEYHMGELYRSDHAHTSAFRHYDHAYDRLRRLGNAEGMARVLHSSRWRIQLLLSKGKAFYELGQIKQSLEWYVTAWCEFLVVAANDSNMEVRSVTAAGELRDWLLSVRNDPDVSKRQLTHYLDNFVREIHTVQVAKRLRGLAGDILDRIGHVVFVLRLDENANGAAPRRTKKRRESTQANLLHDLAYQCLAVAARFDPHLTLARSDLLLTLCQNPQLAALDELPPFQAGRQWPRGGGEFERFARVYEHVLLEEVCKNVKHTNADAGQSRKSIERLARDTLVMLLTHTDNTNVKQSQIYQYLTQPRQGSDLKGARSAGIEFLCLRRYSSFFPFLPRPSAFRVLGGGYLVRIHGFSMHPFGIVIDPGGDFVENLYRCGLAIGDIDMIVITHDHADHMASLDPILSLLQYRSEIEGSRKDSEQPLRVLCNESSFRRYQFYNRAGSRMKVSVLQDAFSEQVGTGILKIRTVETGHRDSAGGQARALRLEVEGVGSLSITSDSGRPEGWLRRWRTFVDADVMVAHLSSVPFSELRKLAGIEVNDDRLQEIWQRVSTSSTERDRRLRRKVEFALWDRGVIGGRKESGRLFGRISEDFMPPQSHLYLEGILDLARLFLNNRKRPGLFVVSELREELGTFRTKVATGMDTYVFKGQGLKKKAKALTADIGLRVIITAEGVRVLCSTCEVDNDRVAGERYHDAREVYEVCVKGENEGVFYNCVDHDPSHLDPPVFVERMERYDVFGRGGIR